MDRNKTTIIVIPLTRAQGHSTTTLLKVAELLLANPNKDLKFIFKKR